MPYGVRTISCLLSLTFIFPIVFNLTICMYMYVKKAAKKQRRNDDEKNNRNTNLKNVVGYLFRLNFVHKLQSILPEGTHFFVDSVMRTRHGTDEKEAKNLLSFLLRACTRW